MNDLEKYFYNNTSNRIHKWVHYFEIYDRFFARYRNKPVNVLEIGVQHGGSLKMWKEYFGPHANIFGMDINPDCKKLEEDRIEIIIGSQESRDDLAKIRQKLPQLDILIDDGGHTMIQQKNTFEELFEHVKTGGIYFVEDIHTSYWKKFGGGYKKKRSFIEFSKNFIDYLHAWYLKPSKIKSNGLEKQIFGLHFYSNVLVIEKRDMTKPYTEKTGVEIVSENFK